MKAIKFCILTGMVWGAMYLFIDFKGTQDTKTLKNVIENGRFCTNRNLRICQLDGWVILTTNYPTIVEIFNLAEEKPTDFKLFINNQYVAAESCQNGRFSGGKIDGDYINYCKLEKLPSDFSFDEKLVSLFGK